jgi:chorismate dehydratase
LLVIARKPIGDVRKIALDRSSRTTQAMVRILCAEHWKIAPEFAEVTPSLPTMLQDADAALLIGDPALRVSIAMERSATPQLDGSTTCRPEAIGLARAAGEELHVYDVVQQWRRMTGLAAVLAFWAARRATATPEIAGDFLASREYGIARIQEICARAERELQLPKQALENYLRRNVDFSMDEENRRGLELYFHRAAELGLISQAKPVEWAPMAVGVRASVR